MAAINSHTPSTSHSRFDQAVVIVGGGPSGASAAKAMADRGYHNVHLYEAYPHPKQLSKTSTKAYVVVLSARGQQGIADATGIDLAKECNLDNDSRVGVVSHKLARYVDSKTGPEVLDWTNPTVIAPRQALTERLLDAAEASGVTIHYQHRLVGIDFENRLAKFSNTTTRNNNNNKNNNNEEVDVSFDLLIGADGSHSRVRNLMNENHTVLKDFSARTEEDSMQYQVVVLPTNPFIDNATDSSNVQKDTCHVWNHQELNAICWGLPMKTSNNKEGEQSMLFAIVFPEGQLESFRTTGYEAPLTQLLPELFRGSPEENKARLSIFEEQLRANQIGNGGLCVWSSSLGQIYESQGTRTGAVLLLGDSGHGMWPSLGQGANCSLESVGVLVKCLDELERKSSGTTAGAPSCWTRELVDSFQAKRFADARAAVDLTYGGMGARESRGRVNAPLSAKVQMVGTIILHKLTMGLVPMPALLRILMGDKDISYSEAKQYHFYTEKYTGIAAAAMLLCAGGMAIVSMTSSSSAAEL